MCGDVERTTRFYSELLEFPLTEMIDNRDYPGSTHFFFDIGNGNLLAFFDFPGLDSGPYAEVLGGLHHVAISVEPERWQHLQDKLDAAGVEYAHHSGTSLYFPGPDGERLELICDPLGEMYGEQGPVATRRGWSSTIGFGWADRTGAMSSRWSPLDLGSPTWSTACGSSA